MLRFIRIITQILWVFLNGDGHLQSSWLLSMSDLAELPKASAPSDHHILGALEPFMAWLSHRHNARSFVTFL